ncbi:MAG TPA: CHASE domain-containing protein, partial [Methylomirabilota bacterium]|nr:CHASE domain-containing protein [Methylomirabilota bacterium]
MVEAESGRSGAVPDRVGPWRALRGAWPASLVLVGALILTLGVWEVSRRMVEAEAQNRLDDLVSNARETLERRMDAYVQVLRGTAALFAASNLVTRDEFREYVALLDVRSRYPGILRIGYAHRVSAAGKASLSAEAARRGVPGLKASPDGERSESYVVMYLEPFEPAAAPALGFDMLSDPLRRDAMERALRSGEPAVTEKTILVADLGEGRTPGIVIFMPVYHRNEGGGAQRGASQGFVFASFHTAELMQEVFRTGLPAAVDLDVFDGMQVSRDHLIFDRDGIMRTPDLASRSRLSRTISLPVAGRTWTLVFSAPSDLVSAGRRYLPGLVLVGGILISGVLFVTALEQTRARARAERAAAGLRRSEYLLREANERFELAAAAVNSVIYDRMIGERTVVWRGGVTELFGYPPEEVQPTIDWWLEHLHPDDRKRVYAEMRRAVRRGGDFVGGYRFRARDGEYREVWDRCRILRDPEGHAVRMVGSIVNVTELKRAEAAVREAEARHRAILESALDAVIAMDHEGRITEFNPAAERMFGYAREAVVKKEMAALIIPPALQDLHRRGLRSYLETGEAAVLGSRIEITGMRSDGTEFPAEVSVTRIAVGGPPMFTAYIRDLTEHKRAEKARMSLEDQLRQAQKMEAVGRLAGGVAHDFNNLLTVITGRAHLLLTRLATGDPGRRDAELIQKTTQRAVALTGKLLAFSRKQVLQPKVLDLNTVVADVAPMLQRMIGEDVELTLVPGEGLGRVIADPGQIEQVLMNLAVNARD